MDEINAKTAIEEMGQFASWRKANSSIKLDGDYTVNELEALAWWMNNKEMISMTPAYDKK